MSTGEDFRDDGIDVGVPPQAPTIDRRAFLAGLLAAGFIAACGGSGGGETSRDTAEDTTTVTPDETVTTPEATTPPTPEAPAPPEFPKFHEKPDGAFLGAVRITYADVPGRRDTPLEDAIDSYYANKGQERPPLNPTFAHRVVVGSMEERDGGQHSVITEENLAHGAVIDKQSGRQGNVIVMAMHNVSPVDAPVKIDGEIHTQTQMMVNAVPVEGDVLELLFARPDGQVDAFRFEHPARQPEYAAETSPGVPNQPAIDAMFVGPTDRTILRTYNCWPPGSDDYRVVNEWTLTAAETRSGEVALEGNPNPPVHPDL